MRCVQGADIGSYIFESAAGDCCICNRFGIFLKPAQNDNDDSQLLAEYLTFIPLSSSALPLSPLFPQTFEALVKQKMVEMTTNENADPSSSRQSLSSAQKRRHSQFRPCIDLHAGVVKQIVGGTLDLGEGASGPKENFVAE